MKTHLETTGSRLMSHRKIKKTVVKEMGKNSLGVLTGLELEIA